MICTKNIFIIVIAAIIIIGLIFIMQHQKRENTSSQNNTCKPTTTIIEKKIPVPLPINQLTHEYLDRWHYVGYVFPVEKNNSKRYPLYARKNIYQKHLYDYHIIDNSRNRVKIYIDVPKGQYQLNDGDKIKIDSESGLWYVRIDMPADGNPYLYIPNVFPPY